MKLLLYFFNFTYIQKLFVIIFNKITKKVKNINKFFIKKTM